jgi:tetratricopeptide (TPR) repeat protein
VAIDREKLQASAQKFVDRKKYDKAIAELLKITQEDPHDARTLLKIGDLYSKMVDFPNAIATYEKVGKFYAQQGFALKAIAVYKQIREMIVKHAPQLEERYAHIVPLLADLFQQLGLTSDALAALDEIASRLMRQQKDVEALDVLRRIVDLDPTNPLPHLRLAEALSRMKDAEAAVREFGDAATLLVKLGRRDDAIKVFERLLHLKPDIGFAHQCAELYLDRGMGQDGMQALAKLQLCFQADPKNLDTLALLARAFGAIGQAKKGIEVQKEMARLAKEQGQVELFKELIDKLQLVAPNDEQVRALALAGTRLSTRAPSQAPAGQSAPPGPVIRNAETSVASRRGRDENSYQSVDSQDFVDESEIEEDHDDSIAARRSQIVPPSAPRYDREPPPSSFIEDDLVLSDPSIADVTDISRRPVNVPSEPRLEVEEEAIVLESTTDSSDADIQDAVAQALADAASFRRVKLYGKALESLQTGLELDPMSRAVHEVTRDVLIEMARYTDAAEHVVVIAGMQIEAGETDEAVNGLYDALTLEPGMKQAEEMLRSLGYEPPSYSDTADESPAGIGVPSGSHEAPLPAYELPDDDVERRGSERPEDEATAFERRPPVSTDEAPLPSFPMAAESEPAFELARPLTSRPPVAASDTLQVSTRSSDLEEVLEEAEFFASRGLYEDARTVLTEQLEAHPDHPLLTERLTELDAQETAAREGSGEREPPRGPAVLDRSFDIAASLDAIENLDTTGAMSHGSFQEQSDQVDVEEVFAAFKEGVAKQVPADDGQSHYDLGLAYREMGLLDDAINEFGIAARDPSRDCVCRSMIGSIQMERGKVNEAIEAFLKGLAAKDKTPEQEMVLSFDIGAAYEAQGRSKEALQYYQRVVKQDPKYRDVDDRIRRLSARGDARPAALAKPASDDDFDRAFDDMLGDEPSRSGVSK